MHIITTRRINQYAEQYPDAAESLKTWVHVVEAAQWETVNDMRKDYPHADLAGDDRYIFNIRGGNYRLIVRISFIYKNMMVKWFGPHKEYDKINARTV